MFISAKWAKWTDCKFVFCHGTCQKEVPEPCYLDRHLAEMEDQDSWNTARCARCFLEEKNLGPEEQFTCKGCLEDRHLTQLGHTGARQFLLRERRAHIWKCLDCAHPACAQCLADRGVENRPWQAVPWNGWHEGKYYCEDCRYPPCKVCKVARRVPDSKNKFDKDWTCLDCRLKCSNCSAPLGASSERSGKVSQTPYCSDACRYPPCAWVPVGKAKPCRAQRPHHPDYLYHKKPEWHCKKHRKCLTSLQGGARAPFVK